MSFVSFEGPVQIERFVLLTLKHGLIMYAKHGIKPNRDWTITNMLRRASKATGKTYKRTEALKAAADLDALLKA